MTWQSRLLESLDDAGNDRIFAPLRYLGFAFDCLVTWDDATSAVGIVGE